MIKSKSIIEYLVTAYGKNVDELNPDTIEHITVSNKDMSGEFCEFFPEDLKKFSNLKGISFNTAVLSSEQIQQIKKIDSIERVNFKECAFEDDNDLENFSNVKEFSLNKCFVEDYSFLEKMNNLQTLEIIAPQTEKDIDLEKLKTILNLNRLILDLCNIVNVTALNGKKIEYLSLLMTEIPNNDVEFINYLPNLKKLYIGENYNHLISRSDIEIKNDLIEETFDKEM